ncbi:ring finger protein [Xylaria flabelliformis]|nr:ring finger protein [Xylaria flabelliformis]
MGKYPYPEVIDLDPDSPVQVNFQDDEILCKNDVLVVFPDICPDHLAQLAVQHSYKPGMIVSAILDTLEKTGGYPTKTHTESNPLKRKRDSKSNGPAHNLDHASDDDNDDDLKSGDERDPECVRSIRRQIAAQGYSAVMRSTEYNALAKTLLSQEFPRVPQSFIRHELGPKNSPSQKSIFEIYTAIDEQIRNGDDSNKPWQEKKSLTKANPDYTPDRFQTLDMSKYKAGEQAAFAEFAAARKLRATKDARIAAEAEEHQNFLRAKNEGQTTDCGICFEECPLNRMVRCDGETMHWFCRKCLRTQAESLIGMGKYALTCMSMDGCPAGFSRSQRALFLNKKLTIALDRIEQEAVLRMAGIENLETCPICPYAAEYPPVEIDKEFRCENPSCLQVSCRLCRKETHIPKTCAEVDADRGLDARHTLEEAMSEALIRRCNQCKNAFVKIDGCNKVRCTKCGTLQCDVCRQTIKDYTHFNDTKRGGKLGQCPLYDQSEGRYEKEVSKAEAEVRKKIVSENPELVNVLA